MSTYMNYVEGASVILGEDTNTDVLSARAGIFECAMELCKEEHDLFDSVLEAQFVTEAENKGEDKKGFFKTIGEFFKKVAEKIKELWTRLTTWFKTKVIEPTFLNKMNNIKDKKLEKLKGAKVKITVAEKNAIDFDKYDIFVSIIDKSGLIATLDKEDINRSAAIADDIIEKFAEFEESTSGFLKAEEDSSKTVEIDAYEAFSDAKKVFNGARYIFETISKTLSQLIKDCRKIANNLSSAPEKYFHQFDNAGEAIKDAKAVPGKLLKISGKFTAVYMKYTALCRSVLVKCLRKSVKADITDKEKPEEVNTEASIVEFENSMFLFEDAML